MSTNRRPLWAELLTQAIAIGGLILSLKLCMSYLDPYKEQREQAKKRASFLKKTLGRALELNEFEQVHTCILQGYGLHGPRLCGM